MRTVTLPIDHVSHAWQVAFWGYDKCFIYIVIGVLSPHGPFLFCLFLVHLSASFTNAINNRSEFFFSNIRSAAPVIMSPTDALSRQLPPTTRTWSPYITDNDTDIFRLLLAFDDSSGPSQTFAKCQCLPSRYGNNIQWRLFQNGENESEHQPQILSKSNLTYIYNNLESYCRSDLSVH